MNICIGWGPTRLYYHITFIGRDLIISVTGGASHIGSISVASNGKVSTMILDGHRDDALSHSLATEISKVFPHVCTVTAGFHLDNITNEEIQQVLNHHAQGSQKILSYLAALNLIMDKRGSTDETSGLSKQ